MARPSPPAADRRRAEHVRAPAGRSRASTALEHELMVVWQDTSNGGANTTSRASNRRGRRFDGGRFGVQQSARGTCLRRPDVGGDESRAATSSRGNARPLTDRAAHIFFTIAGRTARRRCRRRWPSLRCRSAKRYRRQRQRELAPLPGGLPAWRICGATSIRPRLPGTRTSKPCRSCRSQRATASSHPFPSTGRRRSASTSSHPTCALGGMFLETGRRAGRSLAPRDPAREVGAERAVQDRRRTTHASRPAYASSRSATIESAARPDAMAARVLQTVDRNADSVLEAAGGAVQVGSRGRDEHRNKVLFAWTRTQPGNDGDFAGRCTARSPVARRRWVAARSVRRAGARTVGRSRLEQRSRCPSRRGAERTGADELQRDADRLGVGAPPAAGSSRTARHRPARRERVRQRRGHDDIACDPRSTAR